MKVPIKQMIVGACVLLALFCNSSTKAADPDVFGLWNFEMGDLTATIGGDLTYADGTTGPTATADSFGTTTSLSIPDINGAPANVLSFPGSTNGMGYLMPTPSDLDGNGIVDDYTLIVDVLYPAASSDRTRPIVQMDDGYFTASQSYFQIDTGNGIGVVNEAPAVNGPFEGNIAPDTWYRVGFVYDGSNLRIRKYINGTEVGSQALDESTVFYWGLIPNDSISGTPILANNRSVGDTNAAPGYVSSIQLRNIALTGPQMRAIGGPEATGIPDVVPPIPSGIVNFIPNSDIANRSLDIGAVIDPGSTVILDASIQLRLDGALQTGITITRMDGLITASKAVGPLTAGSLHTVTITYTDDSVGIKTFDHVFTAALLWEDFEELELGPNINEGLAGTAVYTATLPDGWSRTTNQDPADADDGVTEWRWWGFADKDWWNAIAGQNRSDFTLAKGTIAIADGDEWDDAGHTVPRLETTLTTKPIDIAGIDPGTIFVKFASSWWDEPTQNARFEVAYDGGAPIVLFTWTSVVGDPNYHGPGDATRNEPISILLNNPAASTMTLTWYYEAGNNWWWAFDNVEVNIGDVPSEVISLTPIPDAVRIDPEQPLISATVNPGTSTIDPSSVDILFDGVSISPDQSINPDGHLVVTGNAPLPLLAQLSEHTATLVYSDSIDGLKMVEWSFTIEDWDDYQLPETPVWIETFDTTAEGEVPSGWTRSNMTTVLTPGLNLDDPDSDSYLDFTTISLDRLTTVFGGRRLEGPFPTYVNGTRVTSLISGNLVYAESDNRGGNQVQTLVSPSIDLSGIDNAFLVFNATLELNQDSSASVEYSIDGGTTWLPVLYIVNNNDIILDAGTGGIDAVATLGTARADQAYGQAYGDFIGATVGPELAPFIEGRIDDGTTDAKRIEVRRMPLADNESDVRLRFGQTGTGSWYFGLDDVAIYQLAAPIAPSIAAQPESEYVSAGTDVILTVLTTPDSSRPLSYQWKKGGVDVTTGGNAQSLILANIQAGDAGDYTVEVSNSAGSVLSAVATVTVFAGPISQDLVVHLPFDGNANSAISGGVDGTEMNGPTYGGGLIGSGCLEFFTTPPTPSYVSLGTASALNFGTATDFSVSYWVKVPAGSLTGDDPPFIANKDWDSGGNTGWNLAIGGNGRIQWNYTEAGIGRRDFDSAGGIFFNPSWHHILATFDRDGKATTYVDGSMIDSRSLTPNGGTIDSGFPTNIGQDGTGAYDLGYGYFVDGPNGKPCIDDVGIWRRVLTAQEAEAIFTAGLTGNNLQNAVVGSGPVGPSITESPQDTTTVQGCAVVLTVGVLGSPTLTYQWKKDGMDIPGATGASYTIATPAASDNGVYSVTVSNGQGSVDSAGATVVVNDAAITGQWDFTLADLSATIGNDLTYFDATVQADTQFGTTADFGIPSINGVPANVMGLTPSVGSWGGYVMDHGITPNGSGTKVNCYTIIYDVLYPPAADAQWRTFIQIDDLSNSNDGELFVNPGNGIGISGNYTGNVSADAWHRIVFAVNMIGGTISKYIDGVNVGNQSAGGLDGRWALFPTALLFADYDGDHDITYVSSLQIREGVMTDAQVAALGTPTAGGIPIIPTTVAMAQKSGATEVSVSWSGGNAPYTVQTAPTVEGPWTDVTTTSATSYNATISGPQAYFRVVNRVVLKVDLSGDNVVPTPVVSGGTGTGTVTLDGHTLTVDVNYSGLNGTVTVAHIHGPAGPLQSAGVLVGLIPDLGAAGATSGTISGSVTITDAVIQHILNGRTYINIHTSTSGGGEIRGQIRR